MASEVKTGRLKVGLIGCGGISRSHLQYLGSEAAKDDVELAAFCDIVPERAQKHADQYGGEVFDDARKMLQSVKLDAAYVLIPTYAHGAPERACLEAGVPFLVEKPLGIDAGELRKLAREVEASGLLAVAGFMNRYRDSVNKAKDLLSSDPAILMDGAWIGGPPVKRDGDYFAKNPIGQWWPIKSKSGGQFVEQVIHTVDLVRYLGGEVVEVFAHGARGFNQKLPNLIDNYDLDDAMVVSMKFAHGGVANIMSCCAAQNGGMIFLNVWASGHSFKFTDWAHHVKIGTAGQSEAQEIKGDIEEIFPVEDRAFLNAVRTGDRSGIRSTYGDGARTTILALAANESLETGKPVTVDYGA